MIFLLVGIAGFRRRAETGSNVWIIGLAIGLTAVVFGFFAVDTWNNAQQTFTAIVALLVLAVILDLCRRRESAERYGPGLGAASGS